MVSDVTEIIEGKTSVSMKALELELKKIKRWISGYKKNGLEYFESRTRNSGYSKEFKKMVILEYINGVASSRNLALRHNIEQIPQ